MTETKQKRIFEDEILYANGSIAGHWNGEDVRELIGAIEHIENTMNDDTEIAMDDLPHAENIPAELEDKTDYPIWACDRHGMCLVGDDATGIESADSIIGVQLPGLVI